jgi:membrane protease YdiL (CAAX protease family)
MIEAISAIVTAAILILIMPILKRYFSAQLIASTILCSIAFIYVGYALKENPVNAIILEVAVALIFYFIAVTGYAKNLNLIAYGIMLHGMWDILHHNEMLITTNIPVYWPVYCMTIDFIWGIYFLIIFKKQNSALSQDLSSKK